MLEIDLELAMDACLKAAGGVRNSECFSVKFPEAVKNECKITHLELWAIILAVKMWGRELTGKVIRVKTDNEAVSTIVNTGRSYDLHLQTLLRELVWWLAKTSSR